IESVWRITLEFVVLAPAGGQSKYLVKLEGAADLTPCSAQELEAITPAEALWWPDRLADWIIEHRGSSVKRVTRPAATRNREAETRDHPGFRAWQASEAAANIERDRVLAEIQEALRTDQIPTVTERVAWYGPYFDETAAKAWAAKHFHLEGFE